MLVSDDEDDIAELLMLDSAVNKAYYNKKRETPSDNFERQFESASFTRGQIQSSTMLQNAAASSYAAH